MKDLIYNIVERQKGESEVILRDSTIQREVAPHLKNSLKRKLIKAVVGPRRSGKSSLIHQVLTLSKESYAYINFEDERLPLSADFEDFEAALAKSYPRASFYFFDEIQVFPRWEQLLNRLERSGKQLIISGSNSKLLSSELSSSLTGRHELFEVLPFSFREYCQACPPGTATVDRFKIYLQSGGFPDVVMARVQPQNYLRELWDSTILKDVVQRYKVRSVTELKGLLDIFRDSLSKPLSYRSLERAMLNRISIATVRKFINFGQGAYLTFSLENFSFKARQRINSDKKAYLVDNGFYPSRKVGSQDDFGKLFENFLFITLLRKGLKPNLDFFYYKTRAGREVDFVVLQNGSPVSLLQVTWSMSGEATMQRELLAIVDAAKELRLNAAYIITIQERAEYTLDGVNIKVLPVQEYLEELWPG